MMLSKKYVKQTTGNNNTKNVYLKHVIIFKKSNLFSIQVKNRRQSLVRLCFEHTQLTNKIKSFKQVTNCKLRKKVKKKHFINNLIKFNFYFCLKNFNSKYTSTLNIKKKYKKVKFIQI